MLAISFVLLLAINALQWWAANRHQERRAAGSGAGKAGGARHEQQQTDPRHAGAGLGALSPCSVGLGFLFFFLGLPLVAVFVEALAQACRFILRRLKEPETRSAIWLTIVIALAVLPFNILFGVAAAWAIAKFDFRGKSLLITLIDLPFAVSPVVAGLIFILMFRFAGLFRRVAVGHEIKIIFAVPGMILATLFITFPFIARELIPLMQAQGKDEEGGGDLARRLRLADVLARHAAQHQVGPALRRDPVERPGDGRIRRGERVSGHIRGETNTLPLHVEILYNEYNAIGAFAAASVLALLALVTLVAKTIVEWRMKKSDMLNARIAGKQ